MPTATQPPILTLVPAPTADITTLPARNKALDKRREQAADKATAPDVTADLTDNITKLLTKLARNPRDLPGLLHDFGRAMYVQGRLDQADDDQLALAQADTLADAALAQVVRLVDHGKAGA